MKISGKVIEKSQQNQSVTDRQLRQTERVETYSSLWFRQWDTNYLIGSQRY